MTIPRYPEDLLKIQLEDTTNFLHKSIINYGQILPLVQKIKFQLPKKPLTNIELKALEEFRVGRYRAVVDLDNFTVEIKPI